MAATSNLNITKWTAGQSQPSVTDGTAKDILDGFAGALVHNMTSAADYTLATTGTEPFEWQHLVVQVTDTNSPIWLDPASSPIGAANIVVPVYTKLYLLKNDTAATLTLKTAGGTGIAVATLKWALLRCDGTNVVRITPDA